MAHKFTDATGTDWLVAVNVTTIKRVRDLLKDDDGTPVNLLAVVEKKGTLMKQLATDPVLLVNVVYVLCQRQCQERNISDEQFGELMAGDVIESATVALLEDLRDFFPKGQRELIGTALAKLKKFEALALERARERVDSPEFDAAIERRITEAFAELNGSFTSSPASPG